MLTDIIPAAWRARVYAIFALVGVALGVTQTIYLSTATAQPGWLTAALAVYAVIGTAIGAVAKANVPTPDAAPVDPQPVTREFVVQDETGVITTHYSDGTITTDPGIGNPPTTSLS